MGSIFIPAVNCSLLSPPSNSIIYGTRNEPKLPLGLVPNTHITHASTQIKRQATHFSNQINKGLTATHKGKMSR